MFDLLMHFCTAQPGQQDVQGGVLQVVVVQNKKVAFFGHGSELKAVVIGGSANSQTQIAVPGGNGSGHRQMRIFLVIKAG